jgi:streptogramin lyase
MNRSGRRSHLTALLTAIIAFICLLSLSAAPVWAKVGTVTEFPSSSRLGGPDFVTAGPDGNLWFTEENAGKIGRITTK